MLEKDLERELRKWREKRSKEGKSASGSRLESASPAPPEGRRTVRVNGQEIVVVKKARRKS